MKGFVLTAAAALAYLSALQLARGSGPSGPARAHHRIGRPALLSKERKREGDLRAEGKGVLLRSPRQGEPWRYGKRRRFGAQQLRWLAGSGKCSKNRAGGRSCTTDRLWSSSSALLEIQSCHWRERVPPQLRAGKSPPPLVAERGCQHPRWGISVIPPLSFVPLAALRGHRIQVRPGTILSSP